MHRKMSWSMLLVILLAVAGIAVAQTPVVLAPYQAGNAGYEATHNGVQTCGTFAHKVDPPVSGLYPTALDVENNLVFPISDPPLPIPEDIVGVISFTLSGDRVNWSIASPYKVCAVIVKGGPIAQVYYYEGGASSGSGLTAPLNQKNKKPYGVSHVTFLFWKGEQPTECWKGETAWATGPRYTDQGNWATYTPYDANSTVVLYAGQTMEAGTVHMSAATDAKVTLTITLNSDWRFAPVTDNVKIQDYATAPSGNPAPGQFAWKDTAGTSPFTIQVPANYFYGIHVDVERKVACPAPME